MNDAQIDRLDGRIDELTAEVRAGFHQVQAAFDDHRRYAEFLTQGVREDVTGVGAQMSARFNHVERRLDGVTEQLDTFARRFDRLEELIKGRQ